MKKSNKKTKSCSWIKENKYISSIIAVIALSIFIPVITKFSGKDVNVLVERVKLGTTILSTSLTLLLFFRTIEVQSEATKSSQQSDINQNFYKLLDIFLKRQQEILDQRASTDDFTDILNKIDANFTSMVQGISNSKIFENTPEKLSKSEMGIVDVFNDYYEEKYTQFGAYFKSLHRIMKVINNALEQNVIDLDTYKMYRGILTSQLSDKEFKVILYNSLFIRRGNGLGIELIGSDFFGDTKDLSSNQHFNLVSESVVEGAKIDESLKKYISEWFTNTSYKNERNRKDVREFFLKKTDKKISFIEIIEQYLNKP